VLPSVAFSYAQDIDQAKEIDAEKYKTQNHFKSIIKSDPDEGLAHFLRECLPYSRVVDSAKLSKWLKSR
jgi:hypothetical protein